MLHEFLTENREDLITRCRAKVAERPTPSPTPEELTYGIPLFLTQIIKTLRLEEASDSLESTEVSGAANPGFSPVRSEISEGAAEHGDELERKGFTVDQVVHDYGDLCQAVTELALERAAPIGTAEFRTLNRCLDNAIADAVTRFSSQREQSIRDRASEEAMQNSNDRLGMLAHDLRAKLNAARLTVEAIKRGTVGLAGATGAVLDRSLTAMRDILDRSLAEVRLGAGLTTIRPRVAVASLFEELQVFAGIEAGAKGIGLVVRPGEPGLAIHADPHTIAAAISNLLQNAVKFTPSGGHISLSARASAERVLIEVADECGGLPPGTVGEDKPFEQRQAVRTGGGQGLSISRRGVEANGGRLYARNQPGTGCVFVVDLPFTRD